MPWKETSAVDERTKFIEEYWTRHLSVGELAERYGISRKTAYKWIERYRQGGKSALVELSRAPKVRPHRVDEETAQAIVELRKRHRFWGPKKRKAWLEAQRPDVRWPPRARLERF